MNIDDLLNKYFEGETTFEEERRLRAFFASGKVPRRLAIYKPMFAYFDEEIQKKQQKQQKRKLPVRRVVLYWSSAVAACLVLVLGVRHFFFTPDPCLCSDNYVVVNGRCYTDIHKIRELAFEALQEVATPANEYFPEKDTEMTDRELIENQLMELSSLFSDDE